jgi:phosphoglycolate phosphatase
VADPAGLIFDLDGTLIHSTPQIHAAVLAVLAGEALKPIDYATLRSFVGSGLGILVTRILAAQSLPTTGNRHARMCQAILKVYEQSFDLTTLYPGVPEMLRTLAQRGHSMAICTNKPESPTRAILNHFDLTRYFPIIIGGDTLPQLKPDPAPLLLAAKQLATAQLWFIGDSEVDAETAHTAQLRFLLFTGGYRNSAPETLQPYAMFDHHTALPHLVDA